MSLPVHVNNSEKDIIILGKEPTQGLHNTTLTGIEKILILILKILKQKKKYGSPY